MFSIKYFWNIRTWKYRLQECLSSPWVIYYLLTNSIAPIYFWLTNVLPKVLQITYGISFAQFRQVYQYDHIFTFLFLIQRLSSIPSSNLIPKWLMKTLLREIIYNKSTVIWPQVWLISILDLQKSNILRHKYSDILSFPNMLRKRENARSIIPKSFQKNSAFSYSEKRSR